MAKKKAEPKAPQPDTRAMIAQFKGSVEFRDWLARLAKFDRSSNVQVLEKAAVFYAKHVGFKEEAPER